MCSGTRTNVLPEEHDTAMPLNPLSSDKLRWRCDLKLLDFFTTTAEIRELQESLGQSRAEEALDYGTAINRPGYNIYAMSDTGDNRRKSVQKILSRKAAGRAVPQDWCYINNFENPGKPYALALPPGRGRQLKNDMDQFVSELPGVISGAFESDEYRNGLENIQNEFKKMHEGSLQELGDEAAKNGLALVQGSQGFVFVPIRGNDVISPEEFAKLSDEEKEKIGQKTEEFTEKFAILSRQFPKWRRDLQARLREANAETVREAVGHMIDEIREGYRDIPAVGAFLDQVFAEVVKVGEGLAGRHRGEDEQSEGSSTMNAPLQRFAVNVIVDQTGLSEAPVVYEDSPNYQNLLGRSDQVAYYGVLMTNFTLIKPGALHRANGGFLIVDAEKLLTQPFAYDGLKRALKAGSLKIESPLQLGGLTSTVSLEPDPIPLDVKVVLSGDRRIYYLLLEYDPEFRDLFRVVADFDGDVLRDDASARHYAGYIAHLASEHKLKPFAREAVAQLIEHSARLSGDAEKLSVNAHMMVDLMSEADHLAAGEGKDTVGAEHIGEALQRQIRRADRVRLELEREVVRGTLMIATDGNEVGQVNGLAVMQVAEYAFAHPLRITANVWLGKGNIIDIERESELGGKIHSKGVMILSSFLAWKFGRDRPLAIGASLVFEQSYGPVEGDSASLAELCALLSGLAVLPIRQNLSVTGSVNQHGRVQAIGGVNEKIEGFFDLCQARGLDGSHGVIIPEANVKHLMLRHDVVAACTAGKFHVYSVATVDEALELLTGVPAGELNKEGKYPRGSAYYAVSERLSAMAKAAQKGTPAKDNNHGKKGK
ncbi:MAG: AAA family ATPase [Turneriella sp.]